MTSSEYNKDDLEKMADELLAADTKRRGSGMTVRTPRPIGEVLLDEFEMLSGKEGRWDSYPSDDGPVMDMNLRSRFLEHALAKLTDRQREAIEHVVFGRLSFHQAGELMGLSSGSVHSYVAGALKKLRATFQNDHLASILFPELYEETDVDALTDGETDE